MEKKRDLKIKVCGLTDLHNTELISALRPDLLGFIFYSGSPRAVFASNDVFFSDIPIARVGVFVNERVEEILVITCMCKLRFIQLHGDESPEYCEHLKDCLAGIQIIKAFNIHQDFDFSQLKAYEEFCDCFLFDSNTKQRGGSGKSFDWKLLNKYEGETPFLLSGGLGVHNIDEALEQVVNENFWGIDINSQVEKIVGIKDIEQVKIIIKKVRNES